MSLRDFDRTALSIVQLTEGWGVDSHLRPLSIKEFQQFQNVNEWFLMRKEQGDALIT